MLLSSELVFQQDVNVRLLQEVDFGVPITTGHWGCQLY